MESQGVFDRPIDKCIELFGFITKRAFRIKCYTRCTALFEGLPFKWLGHSTFDLRSMSGEVPKYPVVLIAIASVNVKL